MGEWRAHVRVRSGDLQVARGRGAGTSRNNSRHYGNTEKGGRSAPSIFFIPRQYSENSILCSSGSCV